MGRADGVSQKTGLVRNRLTNSSVFAQLHPCHRREPQPPGVEATAATEGEHVDLGPKGMYTSVDLEDLEVIMPWIEFRGGGGNGGGAQRNGLGFE